MSAADDKDFAVRAPYIQRILELERKLAEQQALLMYAKDYIASFAALSILDRKLAGAVELTVQLSAAKQEGYEQGHAAAMIGDGVSSAELSAYERGKQSGRNEVLLELSNLPEIATNSFGDALIIHPSAPIAATRRE